MSVRATGPIMSNLFLYLTDLCKDTRQFCTYNDKSSHPTVKDVKVIFLFLSPNEQKNSISYTDRTFC